MAWLLKEVQRQLGVTYKCAWRMCHELRKLMAADQDNWGGPLNGHVEIDETTSAADARRISRKTRPPFSGCFSVMDDCWPPIPDVTTYTVEGIINENIPGWNHDQHGPTLLLSWPAPCL